MGDDDTMEKKARSQTLLESRPKHRSLSEITELEGDREKADMALKERLESLESGRVLLSKMKAELLQNTDTSANIDTLANTTNFEKLRLR